MRRRRAPIREVLADPLFDSELLAKFINILMKCGKKALAEKILYDALQMLLDRLQKGAKLEQSELTKDISLSAVKGSIREDAQARELVLKLFKVALKNIEPTVEVKSRRVGGSNYQVPVEVPQRRRQALSMRWLVAAANARSQKTMVERLFGEMLDAINGQGAAVKKRQDVHRMAEANRAFAHYRW